MAKTYLTNQNIAEIVPKALNHRELMTVRIEKSESVWTVILSRQEAVHIAGGIVLFLIALRMIFPTEKGIMGDFPEGEPFIVPLAVPLLAGPSTLAMLILLARSQPDRIFDWFIAVIGAWLVTSLIMLSSSKLHKLLGKRGLIAVERLMGMVLVAISVQMLLDGITTYFKAMS